MSMRKLVWITDTHLTQSGVVEGVPSRKRLERVVEQLTLHHAEALACVVSGDLTDTGEFLDYADAQRILGALPMPVLPLIGNHDLRGPFRAAFPPPGIAMSTYQQFRQDFGDLTILCLDTVTPGSDAGGFDDGRLEWVRHHIQDAKGQRILVFMHHPPGPLWLGHQDGILLEGAASLLELLNEDPKVEYLFCGHVHRPVSGTIGRLPFTTLRSLAHQTLPAHHMKSWDRFTADDERPQYGVIYVADDRIVIHANDVEGL